MITINLPQEEWIRVLEMLADFPYRRVASLLGNMQQQMQPQMNQGTRPNGDMRSPGPPGEQELTVREN